MSLRSSFAAGCALMLSITNSSAQRSVTMRRNIVGLVFAAALFIAPSAGAEDKIEIVASFSILGDMAAQVGGDRVHVTVLAGPEQDAHALNPAPGHVRAVAKAQIVLVNGLNFEGWLDRLISAAGTRARVVAVSEGVRSLGADPHAWQDVSNAKIYVENIVRILTATDPHHAEGYKARAHAYLDELSQLDLEIRALLAPIPASWRKIVTNHDAFGYFGRAYGVKFLAPMGISSDGDPSASDLAHLIRQIKQERIGAIFIEALDDPRLIAQIARETGVEPGPRIYSDALSKPGGLAASYIAMMRHNARAFASALARKVGAQL
jgi:zinc/manganese transport system substrate-binding protein